MGVCVYAGCICRIEATVMFVAVLLHVCVYVCVCVHVCMRVCVMYFAD